MKTKTLRKRRIPKGKQTTKQLIKKEVNRQILNKAEEKEKYYYYDSINGVSFSSVSFGSSSAIAGMVSGIGSGSLDGARVGASLYLKSIRFQFTASPGDNTNIMRFMIVRPKRQAIGTSTSVIIQSLMSNYASSAQQVGGAIDTNLWHVYYDKTFTLRYGPLDGATSTQIPLQKIISGHVKTNVKMNFDQSGAVSGEVYAIALSDSSAVSHPGFVNGFIRLRYYDI